MSPPSLASFVALKCSLSDELVLFLGDDVESGGDGKRCIGA